MVGFLHFIDFIEHEHLMYFMSQKMCKNYAAATWHASRGYRIKYDDKKPNHACYNESSYTGIQNINFYHSQFFSYLPIQVKKFAQNALKVLKWTFQVIIMTKKSEIIFFVTNDIGVSLQNKTKRLTRFLILIAYTSQVFLDRIHSVILKCY